MKTKLELKKVLPSLGFREVEDEYEYSNGKFTIFIQQDNIISVISEMEDDDIGYLSIPSLKVISKEFLVKVFKAMSIL